MSRTCNHKSRRDDDRLHFMCSQPVITTSVLDLWAKSVTMNDNGVRQDRDEQKLAALRSSSQARKGFVQCLCSTPSFNIIEIH